MLILLIILILINGLFAQELSKNTPERVDSSSKSLLLNNGGEKSEVKMTVAVLSFDPKGISLMESQARYTSQSR